MKSSPVCPSLWNGSHPSDPPCTPKYSILVTSPALNSPWSGTRIIEWVYDGPLPGTDTVKIELWKNTQWGMLKQLDISQLVTTSPTAPSSYSWKIPTSLPSGGGGGYFIKISTNSPAVPVSGQSSDFTITAATQRPGTMSIRTTPEMGALLWINDMGAGTTDSTFLNMPPLTYPVKVALSGYIL